MIPTCISNALSILKAASKISSVKRFVYTSSSTAATAPQPNKELTITENTWNESDVEKAWAPPPYDLSRGYIVYSAGKMQAEQAMWKFVKEEKPSFVFNTGRRSQIRLQ